MHQWKSSVGILKFHAECWCHRKDPEYWSIGLLVLHGTKSMKQYLIIGLLICSNLATRNVNCVFHWSMPSSGMLDHVALVRTHVSEESSASIIKLTRIGELGATLTVTSNRSTLWNDIPPNHRFLREPHGVTSQKTVLDSQRRQNLKS
jgi:hypothetical protein